VALIAARGTNDSPPAQAYFAEANQSSEGEVVRERPAVYDDTLGLAVEALRHGTSMKSLWAIE